jgi:hypothetical protein
MQNMGMQTIELPTVTIRQLGDRVEVAHNKSGLIIETTLRQLDRWGVAQLRKALAPQPQQIDAATSKVAA